MTESVNRERCGDPEREDQRCTVDDGSPPWTLSPNRAISGEHV